MARCPKCSTEYIFDFPTVGKSIVDWQLLKRALVHFVTTCPHCKEVYRAGTEDYLSWKDQQHHSRDEGVFMGRQDSRPREIPTGFR